MNTRDTILDLLEVTTGDRDSAENMVLLLEQQAYATGFSVGNRTARTFSPKETES